MAQTTAPQRKPLVATKHLRSSKTSAARLPIPVALYMLLIVLPIGFAVGSLALTGVRALLLLTIVPLTINLLRGQYGRILWTDILFLLHLLWAIISLQLNNPDQAIQFFGSVAVEFMGGYVLARAYIRTPEDFIAFCRFFFLLVALTLPFAIMESQTGQAIIPRTIEKLPLINSVPDFFNELAGMRLGLNRSQVVFQHPIHYGLFCSVAFSLAFVGFKEIYGNAKRLLISSIIAACVFFSLSSGALLSVVLQAGLILWAWIFNPLKARWLLLLGVSVLIYIVVDILSNRAPLQVFLTYGTFSAHNGYWRYLIFLWGMQNVWSNPIFGLGLNDWVRPWFMHSGSMDNFWLLNAVRYGIPGFLALFSGYAIAIWGIGRRNFDNAQLIWRLRRAWVFTFLGLSFTLATVHVWETIFSFVFFLFGAGMWMLTHEPNEDATEPQPSEDRAALRRTLQHSAVREPDPLPARRDTLSTREAQERTPVYTRFPRKSRVQGKE